MATPDSSKANTLTQDPSFEVGRAAKGKADPDWPSPPSPTPCRSEVALSRCTHCPELSTLRIHVPFCPAASLLPGASLLTLPLPDCPIVKFLDCLIVKSVPLKSLIASNQALQNLGPPFMGPWLCMTEWEPLGADKTILQAIKVGVRLNLQCLPPPHPSCSLPISRARGPNARICFHRGCSPFNPTRIPKHKMLGPHLCASAALCLSSFPSPSFVGSGSIYTAEL